MPVNPSQSLCCGNCGLSMPAFPRRHSCAKLVQREDFPHERQRRQESTWWAGDYKFAREHLRHFRGALIYRTLDTGRESLGQRGSRRGQSWESLERSPFATRLTAAAAVGYRSRSLSLTRSDRVRTSAAETAAGLLQREPPRAAARQRPAALVRARLARAGGAEG